MELAEYPDWLLSNAGPVIRFRVLAEILDEKRKAELAKQDVLAGNLVGFWLDNLKPDFGRNSLHGAQTESFENAMGKLYEFGLREGIPVFDRKTEPFRQWLRQQISLPNEGYFPVFYRALVAAFLAMTGYADDEAVRAWVLRRLETVYPFARESNLKEVYIPQDTFPGFPKAFRNAPLINPDIYPDEEMKLPWIHDVNGFLHSPTIMEDASLRAKVETIVGFILTPDYQRLSPGYGTVRHKSGRYYAMGWSVHLPGYSGSEVSGREFGRLLLLLELLGKSTTARTHPWYTRSLERLACFKNNGGLISFPRDCLPEKRSGVWVLGMRMGLEENRRTDKAIACESAFRFLRIKSQCTQSSS